MASMPNPQKKPYAVYAVLLLTISCGNSKSTIPALPASPSSAPAKSQEKPKSQEPAKEQKAPEMQYAYVPSAKRDPFKSILDDIAQKSVDPSSAQMTCGPLCKWEIEQLKLVAVISGISKPFGMVEDPNGNGHIVKRNTQIGKRNGKVTQVRAGEIVVTEVFKDQRDRQFINSVVIKLPADNQNEKNPENLSTAEAAE